MKNHGRAQAASAPTCLCLRSPTLPPTKPDPSAGAPTSNALRVSPQNAWLDRIGLLLTNPEKGNEIETWNHENAVENMFPDHPNVESIKLISEENLSMQCIMPFSDHLVRAVPAARARGRFHPSCILPPVHPFRARCGAQAIGFNVQVVAKAA